MKLAATAVLVVAILSVSIGYALLTASHTLQNTMMIKGVGVDVLSWIDDTTPGASVSSYDWGTVAGGDTVYYQVCIENTGTQPLTLSFSNTLDPSVGSVSWQIQWADQGHTTWDSGTWQDWASGIAGGTLVGSQAIPFEAGATLGLAPTLPQPTPVTGHIRIAVTINANAPFGAVTPFNIVVTGTEIAT